MICETGTVVAVELEAVWVETLQKTTCGSCVAKAGCGHRLLSKMTGRQNRIRVALPESHSIVLYPGDQVTLGIPENALVKGALLAYVMPVLGLLLGAVTGSQLMHSDSWSALLGVLGLVVGGVIVRWHSWRNCNNSSYSPVLISAAEQSVVNLG